MMCGRKVPGWAKSGGYQSLGYLNESKKYLPQALEISTKIGNRTGQSIWLSQICSSHRMMADDKNAITLVEEGLEISRIFANRNAVGDG
jgi:hypothetical protein